MTKNRTLLSAMLLLTACGTTSVVDQSREYARLGNHHLAFDLMEKERATRMLEGGQLDAEFEALYAATYLDYLRDRGQERIFLEKEDDAIADLDEVLKLAPGDPEALRLRARALYKKAVRATEVGDEHVVKGELEPALKSYVAALECVPDFKPALEGADKVRAAFDRLTTRAQQQFLEGVRKLPEFRYLEVRWHASNAATNDPKRQDAEALRAKAQREIAQRKLVRGQECEAKDQFGAALIEYRAAKNLDPDLAGVAAKITQMEREVQAMQLAERAQMEMRIGRFALAHEQLGKAFELSIMSRATISELMIQARRLEGEAAYKAARDLEILGKKAEAVAAFEALGKNWPDGLLDEKVRIEALLTDILSAEKEWAAAEAAEAAGNLPEALDHYLTVDRFYTDWKDVKQRIASLRARIAAASSGTAGAEAARDEA